MGNITRREFIQKGGTVAGAAVLSASGWRSWPAAAQQADRKNIYIINIDGMPRSYLGAKYKGEPVTPNLEKLMRESTTFTKCHAVLPALTATNHVAIVSSAPTSATGILGAGGFYAGMTEKGAPTLRLFERRHNLAETIYDVIKRESPKSKTAALAGKNWVADLFQGDPATSAVDIKVNGKSYPGYISPPQGYVLGGPFQEGEDRSRPRLQVMNPGDDLEQGCLGGFLDPEHFPGDKWLVDSAIEVIKREDPVFMYILLATIDDCGHAYGNFTHGDICTISNYDAIFNQMRIADAAVGKLVRFLKESGRWDSSIIVVTADHGMSTMEEHMEVNFEKIKKSPVEQLMKIVEKIGSLSVDIRAILAEKGFDMRCSDGLKPFRPAGAYDYVFSEGPNAYIYGIAKDLQPKIRQALLDWNESTPHKPIWKVLTIDEMAQGRNEHDDSPYHLFCKKYYEDPNAEVIWPDIIVFTHKNHMNVVYGDSIRAGTVFVMKKVNIPPGINARLIPGVHGSYAEQGVPLIFVGGGFPAGKADTRNVSVLDILPTLCKITGWPVPKDTKGTALI